MRLAEVVVGMSIDERLFFVATADRDASVEAVGVRMADWHDFLVGVYFFGHGRVDADAFLRDVVAQFREAVVYQPSSAFRPGLVCKMRVDPDGLRVVEEDDGRYAWLRSDVLEFRVREPRPFVSLGYDAGRRGVVAELLPELGYLRSAYSAVNGRG
jgi:hypothetical protein